MKKTVIQVDSYFPTEPTWSFDHLQITMDEQIRVFTVSHEKWGYEYFYEISEEDLEEMCEANGYEFLENGKVF